MTSHLFSDKRAMIALFGGTFDPIHLGHLTVANALIEQLALEQLYLLPNHLPPHRPQPQATPQQRMAMLQLAITDYPRLAIDNRELLHTRLSYTIDSLIEIRQEQGNECAIALIIGQDSLYSLHHWAQWQHFLSYCHLIVCPRANDSHQMLHPTVQDWLKQHQTLTVESLRQQSCGHIYLADTPLIAISASQIRQCYREHQPLDHLLPRSVQAYILQNHLYR